MAESKLADSSDWQGMLRSFATVTLDDVRDAAFTDRVDTKFVLHAGALLPVLARLTSDYAVLDVDGRRYTTYRTQYFDTPDLALYRRHHVGAGRRFKVRTRVYLNTLLAFVEIKARTPGGRTTKMRTRTAEFETRLSADSREYLASNGIPGVDDLEPSLRNSFDRICLVNRERQERLTIDLGFAIESPAGRLRFPGITIAEFKQEKGGHATRNAEFLRLMRGAQARPTGFSKYCMGLALTKPEIKHNLFKPQLRQLRRLMGEANVGS